MRRRVKAAETAEVYQLKREILGELEALREERKIALYYADEAAVSLEPCVPYAWQFPDEQVSLPSEKGNGTNCFALLSRATRALIETRRENITADFIFEQVERFSFGFKNLTVIVMDNAQLHRARSIKERIGVWQRRGLYLFYLPRYAPHLNIVEPFGANSNMNGLRRKITKQEKPCAMPSGTPSWQSERRGQAKLSKACSKLQHSI